MAFSIGGATERAMVSALAPGYTAVTITVGGAISGNFVMGRFSIPTIPSITISMDITVASTGLFIIFLSITYF